LATGTAARAAAAIVVSILFIVHLTVEFLCRRL
jgi:hypothetical protein